MANVQDIFRALASNPWYAGPPGLPRISPDFAEKLRTFIQTTAPRLFAQMSSPGMVAPIGFRGAMDAGEGFRWPQGVTRPGAFEPAVEGEFTGGTETALPGTGVEAGSQYPPSPPVTGAPPLPMTGARPPLPMREPRARIQPMNALDAFSAPARRSMVSPRTGALAGAPRAGSTSGPFSQREPRSLDQF